MENKDSKNLNSENYSCENCGGKLEFNPENNKLTCLYCGSEFEINNISKVNENNIDNLLNNAKVWNETYVIRCENCGAKEILSKKEISKECSFCGATNIIKTDEIAGIKPHGVCPFYISQENALQNFKNWAKKRVYAPNDFKKNINTKEIKGIYTPVFTFDCNTETQYDGKLIKIKTRTYYSNGETKTQEYKESFKISGNYKRSFDDLIIQASLNIPQNIIEKLEPFPTNNAVIYNEKYLSGFSANTYSKDGKQTWDECQLKIKEIVRYEILKGYFYDEIAYFNANTTYLNSSFKYLLLPVYVGHHNYKNKNYNFYVNGSTGKVTGKTPVSWVKVLLTVLGAIGFVALIIILSLVFKK